MSPIIIGSVIEQKYKVIVQSNVTIHVLRYIYQVGLVSFAANFFLAGRSQQVGYKKRKSIEISIA